MRRLRAALPLLLLVAVGIALLASGGMDKLAPDQLADRYGQMQAGIERMPWLTRAGFVALLAVVVATGIPASVVVTIASGLLFGIVQGTLLSALGVTLGSTVLLAAARHALGGDTQRTRDMVERLRSGYGRHPFSYTLFARLAPGFPWGIVTVSLAWLHCPWRTFLSATAIGAVIMSATEATMGAGIAEGMVQGQEHFDLGSMLFNPYMLLGLSATALLALLPLIIGRHVHRTSRRGPPA